MAAPVSKVRARPGTTIGTYSTGVFPEWMQQRQDFRRVFVLDDKIALALRKGDGNRSEDDLNRLTHWLSRRTEVFEAVHADTLRSLCQSIKSVEIEAGGLVCGAPNTPIDAARCLCVVVSGEGTVHSGRHRDIALLKRGDSFGRLPLIDQASTGAYQVVATEAGGGLLLAALKESDYSEITKMFRERVLYQNLQFCSTFPLFKSWSKSRLLRLCTSLKSVVYPRGHCIVRQGLNTDFVGFVKQGECEVFLDLHVTEVNRWPLTKSDWGERKRTVTQPFAFGSIGEGSYFGEYSILKGAPSQASIVAKTVVEVLQLPRDDFSLLMRHAKTLEIMKDKICKYENENLSTSCGRRRGWWARLQYL
jgi:CRP-like cAMP-binding protein